MTGKERPPAAIAFDCGYKDGFGEGRLSERAKISAWLRSLDRESGDINRFLPTTLANWIDERMHEL